MSNVNPQSNNVKYGPPKDSEQKEKDDGKKPVIPLEEDDEFEDFPVEGTLPVRPYQVLGTDMDQTGRKQSHRVNIPNRRLGMRNNPCGLRNGKMKPRKRNFRFS